MNTIKELEQHELTQWTELPKIAREILGRISNESVERDAVEVERDAVEIALENVAQSYTEKTAKLLDAHRNERFASPYQGKEFINVNELIDSAYVNAADTCADYGIDATKEWAFYNYAYEMMTYNQLDMDIDQFRIREE